jgi:hypothetical protein
MIYQLWQSLGKLLCNAKDIKDTPSLTISVISLGTMGTKCADCSGIDFRRSYQQYTFSTKTDEQKPADPVCLESVSHHDRMGAEFPLQSNLANASEDPKHCPRAVCGSRDDFPCQVGRCSPFLTPSQKVSDPLAMGTSRASAISSETSRGQIAQILFIFIR